MATADELAAVPLFASLTESERSELARSFDSRAVSEGVELAGQGASGYSFFILTEGSAVVTDGDSTIAQLGPGDFFGEGAILGSGRRTATVTTTSPSTVLVMFGTEFRRLELAHPEIAAAIEDVMEERSGAAGD
jgi:CRP-like cAMP-binding protein